MTAAAGAADLSALLRPDSLDLVAVYCFVKDFIGECSSNESDANGSRKLASSDVKEVAQGDQISASGTSAVAIDNKIEQAMDLVKSHLMFAVREEVEVLKERIAELMDRICQLETENTILKAHASQEALAQLGLTAQGQQQQTQQQLQQHHQQQQQQQVQQHQPQPQQQPQQQQQLQGSTPNGSVP